MAKLTYYLCLSLLVSYTAAVSFDQMTEEYVKGLIKDFVLCPTNVIYDHIIPPPVSKPYLPSVFLWSPLEHFGFTLNCFVHKIPLRPSGWTDNLIAVRNSKNPRLIFDLRRNVILVQREYRCYCKTGKYRFHDILSSHTELMLHYPSCITPSHFPFKKYHMSIVSFDLIDEIFNGVIHGLSFYQIGQAIASQHYGFFERNNYAGTRRFHDNILHSFPSHDKIESIFLDTYNDIKVLLENHISMPSLSISVDQTLKVGKSIGQGEGKTFVQLFVILGDDQQVVTWKAITPDAVAPTLVELKERLPSNLNYAFIENCCEERGYYETVFPGIIVKQDLHHAIAHITKFLPEKKEVLACCFAKDLESIFRQADDLGEKRALPTASPERILFKLNALLEKKYSYISAMGSSKKEELNHAIDQLKVHIATGCLSGIPAHPGADNIRKFHQDFDKSVVKTKFYMLNPELAIAIFAVLCAAYNSRIVGKKHQSNSKITPFLPRTSISPFPQPSDESIYNELLNVQNLASVDSLDNLLSCTLFILTNRIFNMYDMLRTLDNMCIKPDFKCESAVKLYNVTTPSSDASSYENHGERLRDNLAAFELVLDPVAADGDCLFNSIILQLCKLLETLDNEHKLYHHFLSLDLKYDGVLALRYIYYLFVFILSCDVLLKC